MAWSYDRLWFLLIKKKIKRTDLIALAGLNSTAISKMGKDQPVSLEIIGKLCKYFNCRIEDLVEYVPEEEKIDFTKATKQENTQDKAR